MDSVAFSVDAFAYWNDKASPKSTRYAWPVLLIIISVLEQELVYLCFLSYSTICNCNLLFFSQFRRAFKKELSCCGCGNKGITEVSVISGKNSTGKQRMSSSVSS